MSATSIPVDRGEQLADASLPLVVGNRVLESIGRQEGFSALLAFSELHEQIRRHYLKAGALPDRDLFQTEQFFLDEVLQLICERAQALTRADAVMVALAHGPGASSVGRSDGRSGAVSGARSEIRSDPRSDPRLNARIELAGRASAGALTSPRGLALNSESALLRECLATGKTIRCDDLRTDPRAGLDVSQTIGARATVLVPLCGRSQRVGVVQAFSTAAWSFTDDDVRTLNLFAELILAALRPEDQDRRFYWLADVADDLLTTVPAAAESAAEVEPQFGAQIGSKIEFAETAADDEVVIGTASEFPGEALDGDLGEELEDAPVEIPVVTPAGTSVGTRNGTLSGTLNYARHVPAQRNHEAPEPEFRLHSADANAQGNILTAHPGLSVVMGLVAVAALFSAGVWWGMQQHGVSSARSATQAAAKQFSEPTGTSTKVDGNLVPAALPSTAQGAASASALSTSAYSSVASDNLMDPSQAEPQSALSPVPDSKLAALPKITGVRHWSSAMGTTVVIDLEDQVPYEVHRLMSPERIYFDLHDTALVADLEGKTMDVGDPSLSRVRIAQPVAGVTRIVLDTKGGSNFSVSLDSDPYRLVVELRNPTQSLVASRTLPAAPALAKPVSAASLAASAVEPTPIKTGKFRVVLDPGHGGWDLGTVGRQGLLEKDLVLDVTRRLGKLLHDRLGVDVMFTRTGDDYLPLEQRADFANHAQADLFVSVHANYSTSVTARGVETYYTNLFAAPGAKEVEKKADGSFAQPTPVSLSAGALHEKIEESRRLAASVQRSLYATLAAKSPDIRDRGIKDAAFVVLTGTTMPAILTEISFVSSPTDEHNLQSEAYRQQIAEALYKGIARYQESSPRAKVAQLQTVVRR
ncbi:MAG: N-acetylmuramoyl-L-alanine amidase [Terriglobales bacterium]